MELILEKTDFISMESLHLSLFVNLLVLETVKAAQIKVSSKERSIILSVYIAKIYPQNIYLEKEPGVFFSFLQKPT